MRIHCIWFIQNRHNFNIKQFIVLKFYFFPPASELVDWLVSSGEVESRARAVEVGNLLVDTDYIHHVVDEHHFEDGYLFFRFRTDGECGCG